MLSEDDRIRIHREGAWADQLNSHRAYNQLLVAEVNRRIDGLVERITSGRPLDQQSYIQAVGELRAWRDVTRIVESAREQRAALLDSEQGRA